MAAQSEAGYLVGKARLGYRGVRTPDGTLPRIDPAVAPALRQAFALAAAGTPLRTVTSHLRSKEVSGSRGDPVSLSAVRRALTGPCSAGLVRTTAGKDTPSAHEAPAFRRLFWKGQQTLAGGVHTTVGDLLRCQLSGGFRRPMAPETSCEL